MIRLILFAATLLAVARPDVSATVETVPPDTRAVKSSVLAHFLRPHEGQSLQHPFVPMRIRSVAGKAPEEAPGVNVCATLKSYRRKERCHGLFQTPTAA